MLQMDLLARKIFLNLEINQQKTVLYRYKEPFQMLISGLNSGQITCDERCRELIDAADEITRRLYNVIDWMFDHPEYNPKTKVIPKKDYSVLVDVTF